ATLTATPSATGGTYLWSPGGETTDAITVTPSSTTTYSCVYTLAGCPSTSVSGTVTVNPVPTITINNATVCDGTSATLTATPSATGGTYLWSPGGETTAAITVTPSSTTTYSCVYTLAGCPSTSVSGTVTVNPVPSITISDVTICNGVSGTLTATPSLSGGSYLWSPGGETSATITYSPSSTTAYSCIYTLNSCPSPSVTANIIVTPAPTLAVSSTTICNGSAGTITATPSAAGGTYLWDTGATTATLTISPSTTTTYSVTYTYTGCPTLTQSGTITVNPVPTITINNATVCNGTSATLTATPSATGGTYLWSPGGETTAAITVTPSSTTTYSCVYTLNGCPSSSVSGIVTVNPIPTITINNTTVCNGTSATLTATPSATGGTYLWSLGGETTAAITVTPSSTTTYSCVYTLNTCPSPSVSGTVTVNPIPTITINNATVCDGTSATLTATPSATGGTYLWSPGGETTGAITVTPSSTTTYSCIYTLNTCPSPSVSGTVTVNPIPTITINNTTVCNGTSATLTATPSIAGGTYLWSPGGETTASITVTPSSTTTYSCVYTLNTCASPSVSGTVTVNPIPTITINNPTICFGTNATLTATPSLTGGTYLWSPGGEATNSITEAPTNTSTYSAIYTLNGCPSNSVSGTITVNQLPVVSAGPDQTICDGTSTTLSGSGAVNYLWNNSVTNGVSFIPALGVNNYSVLGTDANGCKNSDIVTITVNAIPTSIASSNGPICENAQLNLYATNTFVGTGYSWSGPAMYSSNIQNPTINNTTLLNSGTYTLTVTANGCSSTSTTDVIVNPIPQVDFNADIFSGCAPLTVNFSNNTSPISGTAVWDFGDNSSVTVSGGIPVSHVFSSIGCFNVTLTSTTSGCTNSLTLNNYICTSPTANASFSADSYSNLISNPTFNFTNQSTNATTYNWLFGDGLTSNQINPQHIYPYEVGNYQITLIANNSGNCPDTATIDVEIKDEVIYWVPNTFTPDEDKFNETFSPVFSAGVDPYSYTLLIFNRWGEIIFESHDLTIGWDGTYGDKIVQDGVYVWKIQFTEKRSDKRIEKIGHVNVLR
ncbi:MAG: gliding motility-associated C-terminal domain-containing protein, partial [Flavobacteriia bacterium]|nr:gliding motility-associated C-terminal domain-containing protein [Flavobacteriia bacterium]